MKSSTTEQLKKHTQSSINWFLDVGWQYATITKTDAFHIARVERSTWHRWLNAEAAAPAATLELLRLHAFGEPPAGRSIAWRGFRFQNDTIITPDGRALSTSDLMAVFFWKQIALDKLDTLARRDIYNQLRSIYQTA